MVPYYFEYVWHRQDLIPFANSLDCVSLVGIFLIPWFCKVASKSGVWQTGLIGSVLSQGVVFLGGIAHSLPLLFVGWVAGIVTSGIAMALPFSLLSDSVDYGEWKTGIRSPGLLTAIGAAFCLKAGSGLGGAIPAWILGASGYVPNVEQSAQALIGINIGFIGLPALFYLLATIPVLFYGQFEKMEQQIHRELDARRAISLPA